ASFGPASATVRQIGTHAGVSKGGRGRGVERRVEGQGRLPPQPIDLPQLRANSDAIALLPEGTPRLRGPEAQDAGFKLEAAERRSTAGPKSDADLLRDVARRRLAKGDFDLGAIEELAEDAQRDMGEETLAAAHRRASA
ncbi:MAG: hypothetical protein ACYC8T_04955, partial [Myxococcaceae bacterium]